MTMSDPREERQTQYKNAILAGGCFWGMQDLIRRQPGVVATRVGYTGGQNANAMRIYQQLLRENPEFRFGYLNFALTALASREYGDAVPALVAAFPQFGPDVGIFVAAASGQGQAAEAAALIQRIAQSEHSSVIALLYATIGQREAALTTLEASLESANDANLPYWLLHPLFRPLRNDPRFQKIVRDVGVTLP